MHNSKINIFLSRPKDKLLEITKVLSATKYNIVACPTITIEQVEDYKEIDHAFSKLASFDYLIFTSQYAVSATMSHLKRLDVSPSDLRSISICSAGPMVSQYLNTYDLSTRLMPQAYTAASLSDLFTPVRKNAKRILFPKGSQALGVLEQSLRAKGYEVVAPIVYKTEFRKDLSKEIDTINRNGRPDCIALTSPTSALALAAVLKEQSNTTFLSNAAISAIGPTTYKACEALGWSVQILPKEYTVQSMARAILKHFQRHPITNR